MKRSTILERLEKEVFDEIDIETRILEMDVKGGKGQVIGSVIIEFEPLCDFFCEQRVGEVSVFNAKGDLLENVSQHLEIQLEEYVVGLNVEQENEWYQNASNRQRQDRGRMLRADW